MNQKVYYIAIDEGKTEGPVSLEDLEKLFQSKKINSKSLIFQEGGEEWQEFEKVLEKYHKKIVPKTENKIYQEPKYRTLIGYYFPMIGSFSFLGGVILALISKEGTSISIIYFSSGFFSWIMFLWLGKIYDRIAECVLLLKDMRDNKK